MTDQPQPSEQAQSLRLSFFPPPPALPAEAPRRTLLIIDEPDIDDNDAGVCMVQCNCACK